MRFLSLFINNVFKVRQNPGLDDASALAEQAHAGQTDGSGYAYIHHPRRVADNLKRLFHHNVSEDAMQIAFLHDVIEDTEITSADLAQKGYSQNVIQGVEILTKPDTEIAYADRIRHIIDSGHEDAMLVKLCDLMDNLHPQRRCEMQARDPEKAERLYAQYSDAVSKLCNALEIDEIRIWNCISHSRAAQPVPRLG